MVKQSLRETDQRNLSASNLAAKGETGVTLIELLVVVTIIALFAA